MNVPKLRFKEFDGEWEEQKLGDITEKIGSGKTPKGGKATYQTEGIALIRSQNIFNDQVNSNDIAYISTETDESMKNSRVFNGDILLNITGASIGRSAVYKKDVIANVNQHVCIIRPKKDYSSDFIQLNISSNKGQKEIEFNQAGGGREGLNFQQIAKMKFNYPSIKEQNKISLLFEKLNKKIQLQQQKIDLLQEQKKGFLQKMFPKAGETQPEMRFDGFTGEWKTYKLGEILKELKSGLSRMLSNEDIGLPVVRANNINDGQFDMQKDVKYWYEDDPQGANTDNYIVHKNNILINFINSEKKMGTATILREEPIRKTIYTTNILKAQTKDDYDPFFLFLITETAQYKFDIKTITKPAVNQASFTTVDFKNLSYKFPIYEEQGKIVQLFKALDDKITLQQKKLVLLQKQKQGFMQQMFI